MSFLDQPDEVASYVQAQQDYASLPFLFTKLAIVHEELGNAYRRSLAHIGIGVCQTRSKGG
jgi:hypothetical protein